MTRHGYWGNQSPSALDEQTCVSFLSRNLCPGSASAPGGRKTIGRGPETRTAASRRVCREWGRERPSERRRSERRWRPSPVRGGKLRGCEWLVSVHRELVGTSVAAVGWLGTGGMLPSGNSRCWAEAAGAGRAFSRGRCSGIFAKPPFLPLFCRGPCRLLPNPERVVCARGVRPQASLTWQWPRTFFCPATHLVLVRPRSK